MVERYFYPGNVAEKDFSRLAQSGSREEKWAEWVWSSRKFQYHHI